MGERPSRAHSAGYALGAAIGWSSSAVGWCRDRVSLARRFALLGAPPWWAAPRTAATESLRGCDVIVFTDIMEASGEQASPGWAARTSRLARRRRHRRWRRRRQRRRWRWRRIRRDVAATGDDTGWLSAEAQGTPIVEGWVVSGEAGSPDVHVCTLKLGIGARRSCVVLPHAPPSAPATALSHPPGAPPQIHRGDGASAALRLLPTEANAPPHPPRRARRRPRAPTEGRASRLPAVRWGSFSAASPANSTYPPQRGAQRRQRAPPPCRSARRRPRRRDRGGAAASNLRRRSRSSRPCRTHRLRASVASSGPTRSAPPCRRSPPTGACGRHARRRCVVGVDVVEAAAQPCVALVAHARLPRGRPYGRRPPQPRAVRPSSRRAALLPAPFARGADGLPFDPPHARGRAPPARQDRARVAVVALTKEEAGPRAAFGRACLRALNRGQSAR